jgi:hypothetical protein
MSDSHAPKGTYRANLADMKYGRSTNDKEVMEYIIDVQISTTDIRRKSIFSYFTGGATKYSEEQLLKMGFNGDFENPRVDQKYYDEGFDVYNSHDEYDDGKGQGPRLTEKWNFSRGSFVKPATDSDRASASQRWRAQYGASSAAKPSTPPPTAPPARKGPPPAAPAAATPKYGKDQAWEEWAGNIPDDKIEVSFWNKCVNTIGGGRDESKFTEADWKKLGAMHVEHPPF